jgi:hypothetical protein
MKQHHPSPLAQPVVVEAHPTMLHRADCWHFYDATNAPPGVQPTVTRPATKQEAATLPTCYHCGRREAAERSA